MKVKPVLTSRCLFGDLDIQWKGTEGGKGISFPWDKKKNVLHFQFNGENKDWPNRFGKIFNFRS